MQPDYQEVVFSVTGLQLNFPTGFLQLPQQVPLFRILWPIIIRVEKKWEF